MIVIGGGSLIAVLGINGPPFDEGAIQYTFDGTNSSSIVKTDRTETRILSFNEFLIYNSRDKVTRDVWGAYRRKVPNGYACRIISYVTPGLAVPSSESQCIRAAGYISEGHADISSCSMITRKYIGAV